MKKSKEKINSLYDFNKQDKEDKKNKRKVDAKNKKRLDKKEKKTKKNKNDNKNDKEFNNRFDFNNEIVIGLTRIDDNKKEDKKKKQKTKKKQKERLNKNSKNINKKNKVIKKEKEPEKISEPIKKKDKKNKKKKNKEKEKTKAIKNKTIAKKRNQSIVKKDSTNFDEININLNEQDIIIKTTEEPKIEKKHKKGLKILKFISLIILIIVAVIATMMSPLFNIKEIEVAGNEKLTKDEIISLSAINIDDNTYRTNLKKIKRNILENPYVESISAKRVLPSKILIEVVERKPLYMIEYGSGFVYISSQGYILEISDTKLEKPILQGTQTETEKFIVGNRLCIEDLNKLTTVNKIMEIAQNNELAELISRIDIENKQNYKLVFETEDKVAYIGNDTDLITKIPTIKTILEREKNISGEIFVDMDLKTGLPIFRQSV